MKTYRLFPYIAFFLLWWMPVGASADVVVVPDTGSISFGHQVEFLEDPTGSLTIDQLLQNDVNQLEHEGTTYTWKKADSEIPNFGYSTSIFWGRVTLDLSVRLRVSGGCSKMSGPTWIN